MIILWKSSMQKGHKDLTNEIKSNNLLAWQLSLEIRTGVLTSINSMLINCSEDFINEEELIKKILGIIDGAILLLSELPNILKIHGSSLKSYAAWFRLRLYQILSNLPCYLYEAYYSILLRELVAEFTLTDSQLNTFTSILKQTCNINDYSLIESDFKSTDYLIDSAYSLEHDITCLYNKENQKNSLQGSLPLGINVLDSSIILYGQIYARISNKYRLQMLQHFYDLLKSAKSINKQALQTNISTAIYLSLKNLSETKTQINDENVLKLSRLLIVDNLSSTNAIMRCSSADAFGRLSQIANNVTFMNDIAEYLVEKLNSRENSKDNLILSGYSLALGCLHRYIGGMGAGKHLTNGVSTLFKFAQDSSSPIVQVSLNN
jgi:HEAT repeat-containing protein 5